MSQRLLISKKENITPEDNFFDCIYTEESNHEDLLYDWCDYNKETKSYSGPWKIQIRDTDFFDKFMEDFNQMKQFTPRLQDFSDVWEIWDSKGNLINLNDDMEEFMTRLMGKIGSLLEEGET